MKNIFTSGKRHAILIETVKELMALKRFKILPVAMSGLLLLGGCGLLPEEETLVSEFYPSYSKVTQIRFWILTESTEGSYLVELYEDGEVVDQRHIPMEKVKEQYYYSVDVDWKLDMDKQYELNLTALNGNADSYVLAANAGEALLPEFGEIFTVGDTMEAGQIVMGINYRYPQMPSGKTFVFYMMSYVLVSILPVLVSGSVWEKWRKRMGKFHRS